MRNIQLANIYDQLKVSSWACVVDVWWKKDFAKVRTGGVNPEGEPSSSNGVTY